MNTPLGFNASQDFMDCMMYGYWGYEHVHPQELIKIESERAKGIASLEKNRNAAIGTCTHAALEHLDKNPDDPDGTYRAFEGAMEGEIEKYTNLEDHRDTMLEMGKQLITGYLLEFRFDPLEQIASECEFNLPMKDPTDGTVWTYTGKIDRVVRYQNIVVNVERKTTSAKPAEFFPKFSIRRDLSGYLWGAQQLFPAEKPQGCLVEVLGKPTSKKDPQCWFRRELFLRSDAEIQLWYDEQCAIFRLQRLARNGDIPWIRNTDRCHNWAGYRSFDCQYLPLCSAASASTLIGMIEHAYVPKEWKETHDEA